MAILQLTLDDGRRIWATQVHLQDTYIEIQVGEPIRFVNDELLAALPDRLRAEFGDWPSHVIEPPRTVLDCRTPDARHPPEYLPLVRIGAEFHSRSVSDEGFRSCLVVAWFQDHPIPVPSPDVVVKLRSIPWEALACDYEP